MRIQPAGQYAQLDLTGDAGTSFPAAPLDGQLFYRTDRRIIYEYDLSSTHWLSLDRKYVTMAGSRVLNNSGNTGVAAEVPVFEDIYVESFVVLAHLGPTNNGSNYWSFALQKQSPAEAGTTITTPDTHLDTASNNVNHVVALAIVLVAASFPMLLVNMTTTGSPAAIDVSFYLIVRSVG